MGDWSQPFVLHLFTIPTDICLCIQQQLLCPHSLSLTKVKHDLMGFSVRLSCTGRDAQAARLLSGAAWMTKHSAQSGRGGGGGGYSGSRSSLASKSVGDDKGKICAALSTSPSLWFTALTFGCYTHSFIGSDPAPDIAHVTVSSLDSFSQTLTSGSSTCSHLIHSNFMIVVICLVLILDLNLIHCCIQSENKIIRFLQLFLKGRPGSLSCTRGWDYEQPTGKSGQLPMIPEP